MSVSVEPVRPPRNRTLLGAFAGAAVTASVFAAGILGWTWLGSAFSDLGLSEGDVQMSALNEYLETHPIPEGAWVHVELLEGGCADWAAAVTTFRADPAALPDIGPDVVGTATYVVRNDSEVPVAEEHPEMPLDQVVAEACEAAAT